MRSAQELPQRRALEPPAIGGVEGADGPSLADAPHSTTQLEPPPGHSVASATRCKDNHVAMGQSSRQRGAIRVLGGLPTGSWGFGEVSGSR